MPYGIKIIILLSLQVYAWSIVVWGNSWSDTSGGAYIKAFDEIAASLANDNPSFKRSVFLTENAYFDDTLSYEEFDNNIQDLVFWAHQQARVIGMQLYNQGDSGLNLL